MLRGKTILLGVTGGIAAYKICELIRMYKRANANVYVVCTPDALKFITKLTLENLSKNPVASDNIEYECYNPQHISLADKADIMVIAPATANIVSKISCGICDNLLTTIACAFKKPIIFAPAMNTNMWTNPVIQSNISKLHHTVLEPEAGDLACGYKGQGRLCSLDKIFNKTTELLNYTPLKGKKIVITAGGTRENIDKVRYISNYSSGKMGTSLADAAKDLGAEVTLITTCNIVKNYEVIKVNSALEMEKAVMKKINKTDCIIMAAAVSDYRAKNPVSKKIKKTDKDEITIALVKNPDILKNICELKNRPKYVIGFCAETENLLKNAKEKITKKGCDFIIANDVSRDDIGFSNDYNEVMIIDKKGKITKLERDYKLSIAYKIFEIIYGQK